MMLKKDKLKKLVMPKKGQEQEDQELELDLGSDSEEEEPEEGESIEHEQSESPEEESAESQEPEESEKEQHVDINLAPGADMAESEVEMADLSKLSDDDLLAELKKRGLHK